MANHSAIHTFVCFTVLQSSVIDAISKAADCAGDPLYTAQDQTLSALVHLFSQEHRDTSHGLLVTHWSRTHSSLPHTFSACRPVPVSPFYCSLYMGIIRESRFCAPHTHISNRPRQGCQRVGKTTTGFSMHRVKPTQHNEESSDMHHMTLLSYP
jgi:hypothetical protein